MRGVNVTTTDFFIPRSVDEAVGLLHEHGADLTVMGGGTLVMGLINDGRLFQRPTMSLARAGMASVRDAGDEIEIGAATTIAQLSQLESLPILAEAASLFGAPAVRHMATVGGNLFAAPPAGDIAVPLLALDAQVELAGPAGRRTLPLDQFFTGQGQTGRAPDELVIAIRVPRPAGRGCADRQPIRRRAHRQRRLGGPSRVRPADRRTSERVVPAANGRRVRAQGAGKPDTM